MDWDSCLRLSRVSDKHLFGDCIWILRLKYVSDFPFRLPRFVMWHHAKIITKSAVIWRDATQFTLNRHIGYQWTIRYLALLYRFSWSILPGFDLKWLFIYWWHGINTLNGFIRKVMLKLSSEPPLFSSKIRYIMCLAGKEDTFYISLVYLCARSVSVSRDCNARIPSVVENRNIRSVIPKSYCHQKDMIYTICMSQLPKMHSNISL